MPHIAAEMPQKLTFFGDPRKKSGVFPGKINFFLGKFIFSRLGTDGPASGLSLSSLWNSFLEK
jgi:hypothetical protein